MNLKTKKECLNYQYLIPDTLLYFFILLQRASYFLLQHHTFHPTDFPVSMNVPPAYVPIAQIDNLV